MKLNGNKNIILDTDITITDPTNFGDSLSDVLNKQQEDINNLKSNVKWIYKYGGVGSGSGGGGTNKWAIVATLDGKTIQNGNTISLDSEISTYVLDIRISGATTSFYVEYSYGNVSRTMTLSAENGWRSKITVNLTDNGHVAISASDGSLIKSVEANYITTPYIFSDIKFYKSDLKSTWSSASKDIFMETAATEGLFLGCDYSFAIQAQTSYKWEFNKSIVEGTITDKTGITYIEVPNDILSDAMNAGLYSAKLTINITPEGQTELVIVKDVSFNLIPESLYLKIAPANGGEIIYDSIQESNFYMYSVNKNIGFNCKAYKGTNDNMPCTISYITESLAEDSSERTSSQTSGYENQNYLITMKLATEGWHKVTFTCAMDNETKTYIKYLYCFKVSSEYTWYKIANNSLASSGGTIKKSTYYRISPNDVTPGFGMSSNLDMGVNSEETIVNVNPNLIDGCTEFAINIGIQYNKINNVNNPIASFNVNNSSGNIVIYQNNITLGYPYYLTGSVNRSIFIPKTQDFDKGDPSKYHLITITYTKANQDASTNTTYYQCCIYIDGILEGAFRAFGTGSQAIDTITFYKGNYSINLLDITYFDSENCAINDVDINYYYTTYLSTKDNIEVDPITTSILNNFYDINIGGGATYELKNNLLKVQGTLSDNVAELTKLPTLVFRRDRIMTEYGGMSVIDWMNAAYIQDTGGASKYKVPVEIKWSPGLKTTSPVTIDSGVYGDARFYIQLQGSSTMGNKSKNFTLGIETDADSAYKVLFSPNYKKEDNETFLPEQMFTLKADVVDSSHTNNTAMGAFINENNNFSYEYNTVQENVDGEIMSHVRQCLEGFPVLVYLELTDSNKIVEDEYYYLGVYNFNLGRESYFNLGYCDLSQLNGLKDTNDTFVFTKVETVNPLNTFVAAEIQGNRKYWDFSQFDQSVLFQIDDGDRSGEFMFGDIVKDSNNNNHKGWIQNFVQNVAYGGGYVFNAIGKTFEDINKTSDDSICYHTIGVVPDVRKQYKRGGTDYATYSLSDLTVPDVFSSQSYLDTCINSIIDGEESIPYLNYNSAVYYYTTCMTFGLVDSVQKNLNIKTWNGKTFGLFFYDMDTSLGTSNSGGDTSYFCFSDYWDNKITKKTDESGEVVETILEGVKIDRDYYPTAHGGIIGYDTPSSYLFGICKYTPVLNDYSTWLSPQTVYANWRKKGGILENADKFIDKYYASNLKDVPACLLNLNYRNKFLYGLNGSEFNTEYEGLKGTKIEKTREWLNGRLHILDAYFNLPKTSIRIKEDDDRIIYTEPIPQVENLSDNKDIYVLKDIFLSESGDSTKWLTREGTCSFKVTAEEYAPLLVSKAGKISRYLLVDPNVQYTINEVFTGQESANFGGSDLWTSLESVNPFIDTLALKTGFYMNSEKLDNIVGDSNSSMSGQWNFVTPAAETIKLSGPNYGGSLVIDDSFINLTTLDLSKSKIALTVNRSNVQNINVSNINSSEVSLQNCEHLKNVNLNNATITKLDVRPAWSDNASFVNTKFQTIYIQGKESNGNYGTLTIRDSSVLTTLDFGQFSNISISNCPKLKTITCSDSKSNLLKSVVITNCTSLTSLSVYADALTTLDLSGCTNLETITLRGTNFSSLKILNLSATKVKNINFVDLGEQEDYLDLTKFNSLSRSTSASSYFKINNNSNVVAIKVINDKTNPFYLHYHLQGCYNLERIYGHISINCTSCFYGDTKFSIHGSDLEVATWKGKSMIKDGVVQMPYQLIDNATFNSITNDDLFSEGIGFVTNISLNTSNANSDFYETNCTIFDYYYFFSNCTNVTNCNSTFRYSNNKDYGVFSWTKSGDVEIDNSPNRYLFARSTNIDTLYECFRTKFGETIKLFSPEHEDGVVKRNNGLFSPLKNVTNIGWMFAGYSYYADRFIFRKTSGDYKLTNIVYFRPILVVDNINTLTHNDITLDYSNLSQLTTYGNLEGFFNNLSSLTTMHGFLGGTAFINYESMNDNKTTIPSKVYILGNCFTSTYAYGEIRIKEYFSKSLSQVTDILGSFIVESIPSGFNEIKATWYLNNDTFAGFKSLKRVGFGIPGGDSNFTTSVYTQASFNGAGLTKIINNEGDFPYDIFNNTESTSIIDLHSIFKDAITTSVYSNVQLPGDMFMTSSNLTSTSGLFYNMKITYKLSPTSEFNNFKNCSKLKDVSYMFGQETLTEDPYLIGSVPKRFFYHGGVTESIPARKGASGIEYEYDPETGEIIDTIVTGEQIFDAIFYEKPYSTISDMKYCFRHCNLDPYVNVDIDDDVENNPSYSPCNYWFNEKTSSWVKNNKIDLNKKTDIWTFDGEHKPVSLNSVEHLDNVPSDCEFKYVFVEDSQPNSYNQTITPTPCYIAPPDLLRYCTSTANIEGLFAYSGVAGWNGQWNGVNGSKYKFGIKGRICPYMLKPVSDTTDIRNMFRCCKNLSHYSYVNGKAYVIPEDFFKYASKITRLDGAFADMLFPSNIDIKVFDHLTGTLNVKELFYQSYWAGSVENRVLIENVFNTKRTESTTRAFCIIDSDVAANYDRVIGQYITFNNVFNSIYAASNYANNSNYASTFRGYSANTVEHEDPRTLVDDSVTYNYQVIN